MKHSRWRCLGQRMHRCSISHAAGAPAHQMLLFCLVKGATLVQLPGLPCPPDGSLTRWQSSTSIWWFAPAFFGARTFVELAICFRGFRVISQPENGDHSGPTYWGFPPSIFRKVDECSRSLLDFNKEGGWPHKEAVPSLSTFTCFSFWDEGLRFWLPVKCHYRKTNHKMWHFLLRGYSCMIYAT